MMGRRFEQEPFRIHRAVREQGIEIENALYDDRMLDKYRGETVLIEFDYNAPDGIVVNDIRGNFICCADFVTPETSFSKEIHRMLKKDSEPHKNTSNNRTSTPWSAVSDQFLWSFIEKNMDISHADFHELVRKEFPLRTKQSIRQRRLTLIVNGGPLSCK